MSTLVQNILDLKLINRQSLAFTITSDNSDDLAGKERQSIMYLKESIEGLVARLVTTTQETLMIFATSSGHLNRVNNVTNLIDLLDDVLVLISGVKDDIAEYDKLIDQFLEDPPRLFQNQKTKLSSISDKIKNIVSKCKQIIEQLKTLLFFGQ